MIEALDRLDDRIAGVERAIVATLLAVMGLVVFLDVMHRVSTRAGSLLSNPVVVALGFGCFGILAFRTRRAQGGIWKGALVGVVVAGLQWAFVRLLPNGLIWSQTLALALTLWLGTMGASLAAHTRRHLALDIGSKLWPPAMAQKVATVGHLATALFCLGLLFLASRSILGYELQGTHVPGHYDLWRTSEGAAGTLSGTAIPKWVAALSIPYGMVLLAFRFTLEASKTWTGRVKVGGDDTLHQLGIEEEKAV